MGAIVITACSTHGRSAVGRSRLRYVPFEWLKVYERREASR